MIPDPADEGRAARHEGAGRTERRTEAVAPTELHALFSGSVQGVGFRWRTQQCMAGIAVSGFVRNLPDGRVELLLQGRRDLVEAAFARVRARMDSYIRHVDCERRDVTRPLPAGFEIRR